MKKTLLFSVTILLLAASLFAGNSLTMYKSKALASYYADKFHGRKTSNGEIFNMYDFTAAHKTLPFNTKVKVTNLENGKSVIVRINDRGPFAAGREIDLSKAAASELGMLKSGTAQVSLQIVGAASGTESEEEVIVPEIVQDNKRYNIQLASFSSKENAEAFAQKIQSQGFSRLAYQHSSKGVTRVIIKDLSADEVDEQKILLDKKGLDYLVRERKN